jgi:SAM-dependent methyltransferase
VDRRLLAKAYDRSAEGYDERFRELQRVKFRAAAPWLRPSGLCVDAGGGTGLLLEWARDEKPELLAARWLVVDLSLGMLRVARSRTPLVVAADLARMPVRAADLVCAFTSVLDDVPRALAELASILRPGGHLIVSFLAAEAPARFPLPVEARMPAGQDVVFALRKDAP